MVAVEEAGPAAGISMTEAPQGSATLLSQVRLWLAMIYAVPKGHRKLISAACREGNHGAQLREGHFQSQHGLISHLVDILKKVSNSLNLIV